MLKVQTIKKQMETFFKNNQYKYLYMNKIITTLSLPVYLLGLNIVSEDEKIEKQINVMVTIFSSSHTICFECLNLFHTDTSDSLNMLKKINLANNYSFPGKFVLKRDGSVVYCCFIDYEYSTKLHNDVLSSIVDSIASACFIFFDIVNDKEVDNI